MKVQQLDNLTAAFAFMEANGVKLVNISPEDIWNGSIKLVLGMIWTIIYQFQVSRMDIDGTKNAKEVRSPIFLGRCLFPLLVRAVEGTASIQRAVRLHPM